MSHQDNDRIRYRVRRSYAISTVSIALVLFLLGGIGYIILNALRAADTLRESVTMYVMLSSEVTPEQTGAVRDSLGGMEQIREVRFVDKDTAAREFREYAGEDFEEFLDENPLPDSFEVSLTAEGSEKESVALLDRRIQKLEGVEEVVYQKSVIEQITTNIGKFTVLLLAFGAALLIISLILLSNTIRLSIFSKRYLINTMKLVGASRGFLMRPFLKSAVIQGAVAAAVALLMFGGLIAALNDGFPDMLVLAGRRPVITIACAMAVGGILISVLFTWTSLSRFINMTSSKIHLY